jgi:hypothetical protein
MVYLGFLDNANEFRNLIICNQTALTLMQLMPSLLSMTSICLCANLKSIITWTLSHFRTENLQPIYCEHCDEL